MASLIFFLRASLRQTMIHKLASVGKDKDEWKKAYDHLTTIMELRSRDKIQRLNLRHSRRLPRLKTLKSRLSAQLRGNTSGAKRERNGVPVEKQPVPVCTVCGIRGHNAVDCWDKLDADQANSTWSRWLVTTRRRTYPSISRLAKTARNAQEQIVKSTLYCGGTEVNILRH